MIRKRLGEMLIESKLLTEEQLNQALLEHKKTGLKLGKFLINNGIVSERQIVDVLSDQLKIEKYHPEHYPVSTELIQVIPFDVAQKHQSVPLRKKGRLLTVAMIDPLDINALDSIEVMTNSEVEPVVCTASELNQLLNAVYGLEVGFGNTLNGSDVASETAVEKMEEQAEEDIQVKSLQDIAGEVPVVRLVNSIFAQAVRSGASDVHISPQQNTVQLRFRIDGKLHDMPSPPKAMFLPIITRVKILANMDITISRVPQDGRFTMKMEKKEINVRVSSVPTIYGENFVMRMLDMSAGVYYLDRLGMVKEDIEKVGAMIHKPYGLILSTGPTGSGKSTSLYAILNEINKPDINIITLEDPVEYRINNIRQVQLNRKAGMTFASGLRSVLRQDPDVIMVGEIRDAETASIAVQAAQTGHRVLSTLHTNEGAGAITRFVDMGIEPFLISTVMLVSIAQRLVRTVCQYCKEPYQPSEKALIEWGIIDMSDVSFMHGRGCSQCMNTGYKGRTGIFEVLVNDALIQDMILKKYSAQEISRQAISEGRLRTLKDDAAGKVMKGITTIEEAASAIMV